MNIKFVFPNGWVWQGKLRWHDWTSSLFGLSNNRLKI